jgi:hypothetical protein
MREHVFHGWGDESGSVSSRDPGAFVLGAALAMPEHVAELRSAMSGLRSRSEKKVHWRDDSDKRHREVVERIAMLPLEALVVARVGPLAEPPERRRRKCFEVFAVELEQLGCSRLTLESRGAKADHRDRVMLDTMRARRSVTGGLRLDHAPGPADPCLWIADALCGAVVASRVGDDTFVDVLGSRLTLIEL